MTSHFDSDAAGPPSILIVDDTPAGLAVVMESLADRGFRVLTALDGIEAIERAKYAQPDVILLDVEMPGIDGFETCRRLKAHACTRDIAVVFMTAMTDATDLTEGFAAGGADYVTKPLRLPEVAARIHTQLALRGMQRQLVAQHRELADEAAVRARTEAALGRIREALEERVALRTEELARANARLTAQIEERRRADAKRLASEARFRTIAEASPVPLCIASMPEGRILYTNQPLRALFFGADVTDTAAARDASIVDFCVDPVQRDALIAHLRREGSFVSAEVQLRRADGTTFWAIATARVGTYDDAPAIYVGLSDVTARKQAEEALRASEASLANAQRIARLGDWAWDAARGMVHWSDETWRILGRSRAVAPSYRTYLRAVHPDDRPAVRQAVRELLAGAPAYGIDHRVTGKDGGVPAVRMVRLQAEAAPTPPGGVLRLIGTLQDVTERKLIEQELLASREQLRELGGYMEAVREEERRRIALEIHDELGQLLTALKMDVALLRMRLGTDCEARRKADDMRELAEKTLWMVRNVSNHLRPAALNFGIVSALEWLAEDFARRTGIVCQFRARGGEPTLPDASATAVFRIAQASLTNVARHARASRVDVTLDSTPEGFALRIGDDGCGFDTDAAGKGYSYGLLGMQERARLIGAALRIDSAPGTGTVVSMIIPAESGTTTP
ncbi:response regulator [Paraburkholderia kururiensis]|uniref:Response regulator n=1 Tax=Paraburkholderia kururiensis TaxID=984307 RepID=A0ABZ0WSX9_9BURK|nr:response regulator [Paraburkholderia kururiensis]WQD80507.1 response regulator [Paraburkholderia kururiensis]